MQRTVHGLRRAILRPGNHTPSLTRSIAAVTSKPEGTIADSFASLSGQEFEALEPRFATVKRHLISGNEEAVKASWNRLLLRLKTEVQSIKQLKTHIVPQIDFADIDRPSEHFCKEYRKRGVAVVKGVIPSEEAQQLKHDLRAYIKANPSTKAFPAHNPQVYELYWSPTQIKARAHPNLLKTQRFLLSFWHSNDKKAPISSEPISYADRLRIRSPGDATFALGPHVDGGSCERWEDTGYGKGHVYDAIWNGHWEDYDPWESSCRLSVESDLYAGAGACSAFRMAQGWLSMSRTKAFEGTLLVNPLLQLSTAYYLLRPFFAPIFPAPVAPTGGSKTDVKHTEEFLSPENWKMESPMSSWLHGANLGRGQELNSLLHPHLQLSDTMVHIPEVDAGDYAAWHCDSIHAVDTIHTGERDSSVLYIPACPLTAFNARYLVRQRTCFLKGIPSPDFPGGVGESQHTGRAVERDVASAGGPDALRSMGLARWDSDRQASTEGERAVMSQANSILGFD